MGHRLLHRKIERVQKKNTNGGILTLLVSTNKQNNTATDIWTRHTTCNNHPQRHKYCPYCKGVNWRTKVKCRFVAGFIADHSLEK
jgi:hypothetical protein